MIKSFIPAIAVALIAGSAMAGEAASVAVRIGDLNPADATSARTLEKRIQTAAMEACGAYKGSLTEVKRATRQSACFNEAVAQTQSSAQVRAFHNQLASR